MKQDRLEESTGQDASEYPWICRADFESMRRGHHMYLLGIRDATERVEVDRGSASRAQQREDRSLLL